MTILINMVLQEGRGEKNIIGLKKEMDNIIRFYGPTPKEPSKK